MTISILHLQLNKEKPPHNYIELKTNRVILTDRNKSSFRRFGTNMAGGEAQVANGMSSQDWEL